MRERRDFGVFLVLSAVDAASYSVIAPALPQIARQLHAAPGKIGILAASFSAASILGFAHNLEARLAFEQGAQSCPHDCVIVCQYNANFFHETIRFVWLCPLARGNSIRKRVPRPSCDSASNVPLK